MSKHNPNYIQKLISGVCTCYCTCTVSTPAFILQILPLSTLYHSKCDENINVDNICCYIYVVSRQQNLWNPYQVFAPAIPPVHTCIYASKPVLVLYSIMWWKNKCSWDLLLYLCCYKTTKPLKPMPGLCTYYNACQHLHLCVKTCVSNV